MLDWEKFALAFDGDPDLNVYLNHDALPRAFAVHRATIVSDQLAAFDAVHALDFDPAVQVVVENGPPLDVVNGDGIEGQGKTQVTHYGLNRIELDVDMPHSGYVVLSEVYYPGWQAEVDGVTSLIYRANYTFRAVYLEPGVHHVTFNFRPLLWYVGLAIAGVTLLVLTFSLLLQSRAKAR